MRPTLGKSSGIFVRGNEHSDYIKCREHVNNNKLLKDGMFHGVKSFRHLAEHNNKHESEGQSEGAVNPITYHERSQGEQRYSCTLSLTSALDVGGWSTPHPGRFTALSTLSTRIM
jgi:hypothetical protein